jgi:hypothetical protein
MQGVGGIGHSGYGYAAMLGHGEQITGGVTATLPDGMTIDVWGLPPSRSGWTPRAALRLDERPAGSAMETALDRTVDQFMAN